MWTTLNQSSNSNPDFNNATTSLLSDTLRTLILTISAIFGVWLFVVGVFWPDLLYGPFWVIFFSIIIVVRLSLLFLDRNFQMATIVWLTGLGLVLTLTILLFKRPEVVFFYTLLPLLAAFMGGWPAALIAETGIVGLLYGLNQTAIGPYIAPYTVITITSGAIFGIIGWVAETTLVTVANWSTFHYNTAQKNMEEARQHRAQLFIALKDLDMAYYRLDRTNAALVAAWKEAKDAEQSKAEFVTYVSHEMRTPLNLIAGFSEMILTSPESYTYISLPGPYREDLNKINQNAQHLLALVDDIVDLARINVSKIPLTRELEDLAPLIIETTAMVRDYIKTKGLELKVNIPSNLPRLWFDRLRIRQVLLNLLVNAARFTEHGWIEIDVSQKASDIIIRVTDTGQGIASHDLTRVFDEYHTADHPTSAWHSGSGLGLPISKKLIELHHGRMGVESVHQHGTTFWFSLPILVEIIPETKPIQPFSALPYQSRSSEPVCILVHADERLAPLFQRHMEGYRIIHALDIRTGLVLAHEHRAIAVITDPTQAVPQDEENFLYIHCPLPDIRNIATEKGAVDQLQKPISAQNLFAAIDQIGQPVGKILVVDDEPEMVQLLQRILLKRYKSSDIWGANSGKEALRLLKEKQPNIILLDIMMPEIDGYQVLNQIKDDPLLASIPVIIISGGDLTSSIPNLAGSIQISRRNGFTIGEIVTSLEAAINALSPGWSPIQTTGEERSTAPSGSPAWVEN